MISFLKLVVAIALGFVVGNLLLAYIITKIGIYFI